MNVLIIGSGGREHAFAWKIAQSSQLENIFVAPGNGGTDAVATNLPIDIKNFEAIKSEVLDRKIDLVVVGPEQPLVDGLYDFFKADAQLQEVSILGPGKTGAQLEGSKDFSKEFMSSYGIPTAAYQTFTSENLEEGKAFLETLKPPYVLKADGLAAGKGVLIIEDIAEAKNQLTEMISNQKFGKASTKVVIEEFLNGIELSVFVLTDGKEYVILPEAKDYKRIGEGDTGLNTGGMGAVSPVPFADSAFMKRVEDEVVKPTITGLQSEGIEYRGFIFIGLMNVDGAPKVIEYNVRMGDPETEIVLPRIKSDLLPLIKQAADGNLSSDAFVHIDERVGMTVMQVSGGYPDIYEKGKVISGLDSVSEMVFHAGTRRNTENEIETSGGRVLTVSVLANSIEECRKLAYEATPKINFEGKYQRTDLGNDLLT